jgi:peptidyl-prolyl cis-trans isomerase D
MLANISFLFLNPKEFKSEVKIEESKLKDFYEKNKEDYRVPERIKLKYVEFSPESFKDNSTVTEDEIETYFIQHKTDFTIPETVNAQHILIKVTDWNNKEEVEKAKKKIEKILKEAKSGKDFTELAKKYSEGPSKDNGGDLGTFKRGEMIKEFEDVAFSMKDGEISDIVKTPYGFHIIKVNKHVKGKDLKLDEAKEEIIKKIKNEKAKTSYRNYVLKTYKEILDASNISAYLEKNKNIKPKETKYFSRDEIVPPFNETFDKKRSLFRLGQSEISNIIDIDGKQYIFELIDKKESYIPEYDKIKENVKKDFINREALKIAKNKAKELIKIGDIKKISTMLKTTFQTTPDFKRVEPIPQIGANSDLTSKIFAKKTKRILDEPYVANDKVYIIQVNEIKEPNMKELENEKESIRNYILNIKQQEAFNSYLKKLRSKAEIHINPNILPK